METMHFETEESFDRYCNDLEQLASKKNKIVEIICGVFLDGEFEIYSIKFTEKND